MSEKLVLVTDFASLRAGMLVVVTECQWCGGGRHRGIMGAFIPASVGSSEMPDGTIICVDRWEILPLPPCSKHRRRVISHRTVDARRLFRVVDEQLDSETVTTRKTERDPLEKRIAEMAPENYRMMANVYPGKFGR